MGIRRVEMVEDGMEMAQHLCRVKISVPSIGSTWLETVRDFPLPQVKMTHSDDRSQRQQRFFHRRVLFWRDHNGHEPPSQNQVAKRLQN